MKKEIADKWIKALRSGNYKQGRGLLHYIKKNEYCCLGVLCDISKQDEEWKGYFHKTIYGFPSEEQVGRYLGEDRTLPLQVSNWAGMSSQDGFFVTKPNRRDQEREYCLADMNDEGKSFKQIANMIEKHWEII